VKPHLLDVNVLIALAWPVHVHHATVTDWFIKKGCKSWATCPLTQCGFIRISSNPAIIKDAVRPEHALDILRKMTSGSTHRFWADELSIANPNFSFSRLLTGHRQVSDAYLLSLAIHHRGILATLDRGILGLDGGAGHVELIGT